MDKLKIGMIIVSVFLFVSLVTAIEFIPQGNANFKNIFNITNVPFINSINFTAFYNSFISSNSTLNSKIDTVNSTLNTKINNVNSTLQTNIDTANSRITSVNSSLNSINTTLDTKINNVNLTLDNKINANNLSTYNWVDTIFLKIADMFTKANIVSMISGNRTESESNTNSVISGNASSLRTDINNNYTQSISVSSGMISGNRTEIETNTNNAITGNASSLRTDINNNITQVNTNIQNNWTDLETRKINVSNEGNLNVNKSNYWDNMNTINSTQIENNGGILNILESWLTTFINSFGFITTWLIPDTTNGYLFNDSTKIYFNDTKLATIYYNATQSLAIVGTIDGGTLSDTQHQDGKYDGNTFNFSEVSATPGLDLRINFTGIDSFNQGVMRYKTASGLSGAYPIIQMWNYNTGAWEDYPPVAQSLNFATITQPVFDSSDHVSGGVAQMRIYKATKGNTGNKYYIDWIAISKGFGTPSGEEVDPYSYHKDENINAIGYNITTDYLKGNMDWTNLTNYPVSCPDGTYLTQLDDSVTCTTVHGNITVSYLNVTSNITMVNNGTICLDSLCNHFIYENSTGAVIIE